MRRNRSRALVAVATAAALALAGCSAGANTPDNGTGTTGEQSGSPSSEQPTGGPSSTGGEQGVTSGSSTSESQPSATGSGGGSTAEGSSESSRPKPTDGTLNLGLTLEPVSLDFTTEDGAPIPRILLDNVYETLVDQAQDGSIVPGLATKWTLSDDRTTYDFTLRDGVTFSDGSSFTAEDAAFSINYVKTKWTVGVAKVMDVVKSATAVSPTELKVVLKHPDNLWLFKMTTRIGAMMSPDHVDHLGTEAIGTGPFTVGEWKHGQSITLNRNPNYWGPPALEKHVVFKYYKDATAVNNALTSGAIDFIGIVSKPQTMSQFENNPKYKIIEGTTNGKVMMTMNDSKPPLNNKKVRRAINYALDQKAILQGAWAGYGQLIGSHEVPTDPWFVDLANRYPHNVAKAKELLKEAGQSNLTLTLKLPDRAYAQAAAPIIVSQLAQAGITVKIKNITFDNWLAHVFAKPFDYQLTIVNHVEQYDVVTVFDGTKDYYTQYQNPKVAKLEQEGLEGDHEAFIKDFQQVMKILADDAAAAWLWAFPNLMVADKDVHGLPKNLIGESLQVYDIYKS